MFQLSYLTAILPYVVMVALLIQAALLPGSYYGILYYITPTWSALGSAKVRLHITNHCPLPNK